MPLELNPDPECETLFDESNIAGTSCSGDFVFTVIDPVSGNTIASDTNSVRVNLKPFIGGVICLSVFDQGSDSTCLSYYEVIDTMPPVLICPLDTVACTEFPDSVASIIIIEDCGIVDLSSPVDSFGIMICMNNEFKRVFRNYSANDGNGNTATCQQIVMITTSDIQEVEFPADTVLNCGEAFDESITGSPTLNGVPFAGNPLCNLKATFDDDTNNLDCGNIQILREWTVVDDCNSNNTRTETQIILLVDTIPPVFAPCIPLYTFNADVNCDANPVVPIPNVTDWSPFEITAVAGGTIGGTVTPAGIAFSGLTEGLYSLKFIATDTCGNVDSCLSQIRIVDVTTPNAVCEGDLVVTLNNGGNAYIPILTFWGQSENRGNCMIM